MSIRTRATRWCWRDDYLELYRDAMSAGPKPDEEYDVETRYGTTRVYRYDQGDAPPIVCCTGSAPPPRRTRRSSRGWQAGTNPISAGHRLDSLPVSLRVVELVGPRQLRQ